LSLRRRSGSRWSRRPPAPSRRHLENGTTRNFTYDNKPEFREGDRVRTLDDGRRLALVAN